MLQARLSELETEFQIKGNASLDRTDLQDIFYIIESNKQIDDALEPMSEYADEITTLCNQTEKMVSDLQTHIEMTIRMAKVNDLPDRFQTAFIGALETMSKKLSKIGKKVNGKKDSIVKSADQIHECRYSIQQFT
jgi:uncharacterized coiled-coil DUF342 family protein